MDLSLNGTKNVHYGEPSFEYEEGFSLLRTGTHHSPRTTITNKIGGRKDEDRIRRKPKYVL